MTTGDRAALLAERCRTGPAMQYSLPSDQPYLAINPSRQVLDPLGDLQRAAGLNMNDSCPVPALVKSFHLPRSLGYVLLTSLLNDERM